MSGAVSGNPGGIETVERAPVVLALVQDRQPAEAGLGALQDEELEERAVVVLGHSPLGVVVGEVRGRGRPGAAGGSRRHGERVRGRNRVKV